MIPQSAPRNKAISVKMSEKVHRQFVDMALNMDLLPSTMAYLIIKKYMQERTDIEPDKVIDDLV